MTTKHHATASAYDHFVMYIDTMVNAFERELIHSVPSNLAESAVINGDNGFGSLVNSSLSR